MLHTNELDVIGKLFSIESFHVKRSIYGMIIGCLKDDDGEEVYRVLSSEGISYLYPHDFEITFYD